MKEVSDVLSRTSRATSTRKAAVATHELAATAVEALLAKKGHDIVVMDMRSVSGMADMFILATGDSDLQIKALADGVRDALRETHNERTWHREGYEHRQWILLDYVDLVVHVFDRERREYYGLERLWGDAPSEAVPEDSSGNNVAMLKAMAAS